MVSEIKVMIGVPTAGMIRNSLFIDFFNQLEKPNGSVVSFSHGASPAKGRNLIIETALESQCTHILFIDDDMAPPPYALMRLLSHDKDIVSGLYLMRNYPHFPVVFDEVHEGGFNKHFFLVDNSEGLIEATNAGLGFVLIKTEVFRKMDRPWITLGELDKEGWCDDISFFNRVRGAGFKIYCDLECQIGHMTQTIVTPLNVDGKWFTKYNTGSPDVIQLPQLTPEIIDLAVGVK